MRFSISIVALLIMSPAAFAQDIDFGDDSSRWANDGQCDDLRFEGPGMTTTMLLDSDVLHDATDCSDAFSAGTLTYIGSDSATTQTPDETPTQTPAQTPAGTASAGGVGGGTKGGSERARPGSGMPETTNVMFDGINFGDDQGPYVSDGECDDRRFIGTSMTTSLGWEHMGHDATDCLAGYQAGSITLWNAHDSAAETQCTAIDFGDDSGEFPTDSECDDYRFEGLGAALNLRLDAVGQDASDCQRLCSFGLVTLRDY